VGTGVLLAGGNFNLVHGNEIYDNWRYGVVLFWVPGVVRGDTTPLAQLDTSHNNRVADNRFGFHPAGVVQPNGTDLWWDEQGLGNCWEGNVSATGSVTEDALLPLPTCSLGSLLPVGDATKSIGLLPCSAYNRRSNPAPTDCDWYTTPAVPAGRQAAPGEGGAEGDGGAAGGVAPTAPASTESSAEGAAPARDLLPATGSGPPLPLAALVGVAAAVALAVRRRASRPR
jgi:hypothetical protein